MQAAAVLLGLGVAACSPSYTLHDTQTLHNAEASRVWIIQRAPDGDHVILCESAWPGAGRPLCISWPPPPRAVSAPAP